MVQTRRQASAKRDSAPLAEAAPRRRKSRKAVSVSKAKALIDDGATKRVRFADAMDEDTEPVKPNLIPTPKKSIELPKQRAVKFEEKQAPKPTKSSLKRRLDVDEQTQRPSKKISLEDMSSAAVLLPSKKGAITPERPQNRIPVPSSSIRKVPSIAERGEAILPNGTPIFEAPSSILRTSSLGQSLLTPAKRPAQPLKDTTPALRRPMQSSAADENPFVAGSVAPATPSITASARRNPIKSDLFGASINLGQSISSTPARSGFMASNDLVKNNRVLSSSVLATPARRPPGHGLASAVAARTDTSRIVSQPAPMTCPPKRLGIPKHLSTPPNGKKPEIMSKLGNLATPAQRPKYAASPSFARPTQASEAKSSPSPLKKAPRRGVANTESTPVVTNAVQPSSYVFNNENISASTTSAKPVTPSKNIKARLSSPTRLIQTERKPTIPFRPSIHGGASPRTPQAKFIESLENARPSSVDSFKRRIGVNRKLDFSPGSRDSLGGAIMLGDISQTSKTTKIDIDIYVDKDAREETSDTEMENEDSMTTEEVFGNNLPSTLGSRRESGIFMSSPDRSVSIGPFTTRISPKKSPLRAEYTKELAKEESREIRASLPGNIFLDSFDRTPKLIHRETVKVPLKG